MFTTIDDVQNLTGYTVTLDTIRQAQGIIESYVGRAEIEVLDVNDIETMRRAVAYQSAYMKDHYDRVFEQVGVKQIAQSDGMITVDYEKGSPFIAPLAAFALRNLSWRGVRSVHTGPVNHLAVVQEKWVTD
jgi:hypothetical protein